MTRWSGVLGLTAALLGAAACGQRAQEVQTEAELAQTVQRMMPAVERATGLTFRHQPAVLRRSRAQVHDYVIHKLDHDLPPAELAGGQAAYRLFGLVPDTLDLRRVMIDLLTEQVAGYFDPDSDALYLPSDIDPGQARLVISHELVHALQDQYLNLDSLVELKRQNDRGTAAQSILEGQATLAQIQILMPEQKIESLPNLMQLRGVIGGASGPAAEPGQMRVFASAPLWLRQRLIFPYLGGAEFVRWFDHTYPGKEPYGPLMPVSTSQILHPARYAAGQKPRTLVFTSPHRDLVRYEDGLGEFEIRLLFEQHLGDDSVAALLANGWDGDRYEVLGAHADVLVWYTVWVDRVAAQRFSKGLERAWAKRRASARPGRRAEVKLLRLGGRPAVRLVDAPARWRGWRRLPAVRLE